MQAFSVIRRVQFACAGFALLAAGAVYGQEAAPTPMPLSDYGSLPGVEDVAISDSGQHIAIVAMVGDARRLLVLDGELKLINQMGTTGIKLRGMRFVGDEALVIYRSDTIEVDGFAADKYEMTQALVMPLDPSREVQSVFGNNRRLSGAIFGNHGIRLVDGHWKGYYGALEFARQGSGGQGFRFNHGRPYLYAFDFAEMDERRVAVSAAANGYRDWLVDAQGEVAATLDIDRRSGNWEIRNRANDRIVQGVDPAGDVALVGLGHDGTSVIYANDDNVTGETLWLELPLAGGTSNEFLEDVEVDRVYWNRNTGEYLGYKEDSAKDRQIFHDAELQHRAQMIADSFIGRNAEIVEWTQDMGRAIVHTQGNDDSGTWYFVDVVGRRADPIGYDRPNIDSPRVGAISTVSYTAQDGLAMEGILTLPPGREASNLPLIMLPHGGPHANDSEGFDWLAQAFASRGYAVFQPNFRGSTGYGHAFKQAGYGEWGGKMQSDISDGLAALAQRGIIDPERACIVGASYGGYAALAGVTVQQGLYRCAVSVGGISDLRLLYRTENSEAPRDRLVRRSLEEELGDNSLWRSRSPRDLAAQADAPILLIHGINDTVVSIEQSRVMSDSLKDEGKPHQYVMLEGEDHWLSTSQTRNRMLEETMAFVLEHNPAD